MKLVLDPRRILLRARLVAALDLRATVFGTIRTAAAHSRYRELLRRADHDWSQHFADITARVFSQPTWNRYLSRPIQRNQFEKPIAEQAITVCGEDSSHAV